MIAASLFSSITAPILGLVQDAQAPQASDSTALAVSEAAQAISHAAGTGPMWALLIPGLPILGVILATLCAIFNVKSKLPAWLTVASLAGSFFVTVALYNWFDPANGPVTVHAWDWFAIGDFKASFGLYIDTLTIFWMLFVTGLATLIGLYASEYMAPDVGQGYNRFFFAFNLFVFSMACLVMGSGLAMLYLGWEGVGLCSYLLIGYYYKKDSAVQAAKKAFIVNRIGDLGLALGLYLTFAHFGTIEYAELFAEGGKLQSYTALAMAGDYGAIPAQAQWIPILLMIGAFGKSAQFPLYVWLPDAMEGPTPVSALIHAATMVTAGVYLIARFYPIFVASEYALPIVAWVGTFTALLAATIAMAQFDIKRIMAYSTVSQLGYMFAGLGVLSPTGAGYHVLTHAFFKALLFLACGAVMHGFAGQLDLRKLSGLGKLKGWGIVTIGMFVGCINLAGVPFTAGFFSKDTIIAEAFVTPGSAAIGWILLFTAGLTAYYTFRVFFRVFMGPVHFEPGDEYDPKADHAHSDDHGHDDHAHGGGGGFHPHAPGWAINTVLATLAVCSLLASGLYIVGGKDLDQHGHTVTTKHYAATMIQQSTASFTTPYDHHGFEAAAAAADGEHAAEGEAGHAAVTGPYGELAAPNRVLGLWDPHKSMYYISAAFGVVGIGLAYLLHLRGRTTAAECKMDAIAKKFGPIPRWAEHKWYVDEFYEKLFRGPLHIISNHVLRPIDRFVIDGLVNLVGWLPRIAAGLIRPSQSGELHGYATGMVVGLTVLLFLILTIVASLGGVL
ncbi:MAG: NADH-quinone oxidoreductase subunit L [Phycisphaerales bacterium]|jgi:NADH-quinone oxidoreductase subunit L